MDLWATFLDAAIVVQFAALALLAIGVGVGVAAFVIGAELRRANRAADGFEDRFWSGGSLEELQDREGVRPSHAMAAVFGAGMGELRASMKAAAVGTARERVAGAMRVVQARAMERLARWQPASDAGGLAALMVGALAVACGARPAVAAIGASVAIGVAIARTLLAAALARFAARLEGFAVEFSAILGRQMETPAAAPGRPPAEPPARSGAASPRPPITEIRAGGPDPWRAVGGVRRSA